MSATMEEVDQVQRAVHEISHVLAGRPPEIQGAILADLLATFLAGHYKLGDQTIERILTVHIKLVRRLVPANIEIIRRRHQ